MKVLVTGTLGYVGPWVVRQLRRTYPKATLVGFDNAYFAACLASHGSVPERLLNAQYYGDIREFDESILQGVDAIVHLAGISNDPVGNRYEDVTFDVNHRASVRLAERARSAGVRSFVFASSCSIYGTADDKPRNEESDLRPLTAYAKSKVFAERDLAPLAAPSFAITCLRFATACGWSDRFRLDLVLNDFVASAVACGEITILSDGTPWRPLINVKDMARAVDWAVGRSPDNGREFLAVNIGSQEWNYQVRELAEATARVIGGVDVSINENAEPDKRSYKVDFSLFRSLAPHHQPQVDLETTIGELQRGMRETGFRDGDFRNSNKIRLKVLDELRGRGLIDERLGWIADSQVESQESFRAT